ncbi:MAG: hypothetical protein LUI10_09845 [Lachnospiraceae bacterium]|nr:hypothetical protein [Lachnospiraceae bacterium]
MFWDAKKTARLNQEYQGKFAFLQNNIMWSMWCILIAMGKAALGTAFAGNTMGS